MKKILYFLPLLFCLAFITGCDDDKVVLETVTYKGNPENGTREVNAVYQLNKELRAKYDDYFNSTYIQVANILNVKAPEIAEYNWIDSINPYNYYKTLECTFSQKAGNKKIVFTFRNSEDDAYETIEYISNSVVDIKKMIYSKKSTVSAALPDSRVMFDKFDLMGSYCADQLVRIQGKK